MKKSEKWLKILKNFVIVLTWILIILGCICAYYNHHNKSQKLNFNKNQEIVHKNITLKY